MKQRSVLASLVLAALALPVAAHDTWFSPARAVAPAGTALLELTTGNRYPVQEFNPSADSLVRAQCTDGSTAALPLRPVRDAEKWLELRAQGSAPAQPPLACWAELKAYDLDMAPELVPVYFNEIRASAAQRQAWAAIQARGGKWLESYRKFARIELPFPRGTPAERITQARRPVGLDLELVVLGEQLIATGQPLVFRILRDGRPLAGQPIELVSERSALGIWRESDDEGIVRHTLPFAGRWLLRATELRLDEADATRWRSRFVTLAIEAK